MRTAKTQLQIVRDNTLKKEKWNLFVGDKRYKTNFILQFLDRFTKTFYERQLIPSSMYSIRTFIAFLWFFDIFIYWQKMVFQDHYFLYVTIQTLAALGSLFSTTKQCKHFHPKLKLFLLVNLSTLKYYRWSSLFS